ncbi:MAG: outer membrane protein assembly factor BamD [Candidatus Hydrogenedentes bacterium]|nr:outer membrane protein assembly factor BamD [Candidatus Hydrogenedentota bacterium]
MISILSTLKDRLVGGGRRREAETLIAQEFYEPLSETEANRLEYLLKQYPDLKEERQSLRQSLAQITLTTEELPWDLTAALRARLHAEDSPKVSHRRFSYAFAALALVILSVSVYTVYMLSGTEHIPVITQETKSVAEPESQLAFFQQQACDQVARGESEEAADQLEQAINDYPNDALHADALLTLADIEYSYLQRYDRAYETYKHLEDEHSEVLDNNWYYKKRMQLLAAALPQFFTPLRELETAAHSENPMRSYENLLVEYPDSPWAEEALNQMCRVLARTNNMDLSDTVGILKKVRGVCDHPVARDRVDLELGNCYCDLLNDPEQARQRYMQAAESRHLDVAFRAKEALARLD